MAVTPTPAARTSIADTLAVYLQRRVLIVMFLGFSSGLPLALSGSTLLIWMRESGVNLDTIGSLRWSARLTLSSSPGRR